MVFRCNDKLAVRLKGILPLSSIRVLGVWRWFSNEDTYDEMCCAVDGQILLISLHFLNDIDDCIYLVSLYSSNNIVYYILFPYLCFSTAIDVDILSFAYSFTYK